MQPAGPPPTMATSHSMTSICNWVLEDAETCLLLTFSDAALLGGLVKADAEWHVAASSRPFIIDIDTMMFVYDDNVYSSKSKE